MSGAGQAQAFGMEDVRGEEGVRVGHLLAMLRRILQLEGRWVWHCRSRRLDFGQHLRQIVDQRLKA